MCGGLRDRRRVIQLGSWIGPHISAAQPCSRLFARLQSTFLHVPWGKPSPRLRVRCPGFRAPMPGSWVPGTHQRTFPDRSTEPIITCMSAIPRCPHCDSEFGWTVPPRWPLAHSDEEERVSGPREGYFCPRAAARSPPCCQHQTVSLLAPGRGVCATRG